MHSYTCHLTWSVRIAWDALSQQPSPRGHCDRSKRRPVSTLAHCLTVIHSCKAGWPQTFWRVPFCRCESCDWLNRQQLDPQKQDETTHTSTPQAPHPASGVQECHWIRTSAIHRLLSSIWVGLHQHPLPKVHFGLHEQSACCCLSRILAILSYKLLYIRTARILYYRYDIYIYIYVHILHVIICYIYILNCIDTNIQILDSMYIYIHSICNYYIIYIHAIVIYII